MELLNLFYAKEKKYWDKFGDVFPSMEYDLPLEEAIEFMDRCIKENKEATDLIPLRDDVIY